MTAITAVPLSAGWSPEGPCGLLGVDSADVVTAAQVAERVASRDFDRWQAQVAGCGHCARPVRLRGRITRVDRATGAVTGTVYDTRGEPDGVLLLRCRNRRSSVCPSCSREYAGDLWHLLHAGIAGGSKGVPDTVASRPAVFVTLTAPSFGTVHSTRADQQGRSALCRPRRTMTRCEHGRLTSCHRRHAEDDPRLGQPLCPDCYDYQAAVWFNAHASAQLWRRFTTYLPRALAALLGVTPRELRRSVRVQYAKVAEFQRRGVVHFHAVLRLDGPPHPGEGYPPPLLDVPVQLLAQAVRDAAGMVSYRVPAWASDRPGGVVLRFGRQVDATAIRHGDALEAGTITPTRVAAYIAKYATKAADDLGLPHRVADPAALEHVPSVSPHVRRLVHTVAELAETAPGLGRWLHMLGFPGHFATKSRAFSTTLGAIRAERRHHHEYGAGADADEPPGGLVHDDGDSGGQGETTLLIGSWVFAGLGYTTQGDALLAAAAAARAREERESRRPARARGPTTQGLPGARPQNGVRPVAAISRSERGGSRVERSEIT